MKFLGMTLSFLLSIGFSCRAEQLASQKALPGDISSFIRKALECNRASEIAKVSAKELALSQKLSPEIAQKLGCAELEKEERSLHQKYILENQKP